MSYDNTQLTSAIGFTRDRLVFPDPVPGEITLGDGKKITFFRIPICVKNPDGTIGELVFGDEGVKYFTFGPQENKNDKGLVDGYSVPICLWDIKNGPDKKRKAILAGINEATEGCKEHVIEVKDKIERYDLEPSDLKKFNPVYYKREKGKIVADQPPRLYPKLITSKKGLAPGQPPKILTNFENTMGEEIDATDYIGKYCTMETAIKYESIFIGSKITPQLKLYEAIVQPVQQKAKRLLRPKVDQRVKLLSKESSVLGRDDEDDDDAEASESDTGSLELSDEDEEEEEEEEEVKEELPKKKVVKKKIVRKKVKKKN